MKWMFFLYLAGCAVKCDVSNNYYVVQMPEEDPLPRRNTLQVYWNVPTMQCKSKKIPFENLFEKFGIIQNTNDSFRGEKVAILYDPGYFPALLRNESSGQLRFRNGGVPQEGDLILHLKLFESVLEQSIPDKNFNGIGIIDFESWRPILRQNFGEVLPYKEVSYKIEKKRHWWWPQAWVQAEAKKQFEDSARIFMQDSLMVAKRLRPQARWGYYGFPYCFNMATHNMAEGCAKNVNEENDQIDWLWAESTALYPSVYSPKELTSSQLSQMINGRIKEAVRVRRTEIPILPYFWFRYRNGGFLRDADLHVVLETFNKSEASGFLIWGSSNDVNTIEKCQKLYNYIENVMGPALVKYTKGNKSDDKKQEVLDDDEGTGVTFTTEGVDDHSTTTSSLIDDTTEQDFNIETQTTDPISSVTETNVENPLDKYDVTRVRFGDMDYEETPQNTKFPILAIFNHSTLMDIFERAVEDYGDSDENTDYKVDASTQLTDEKATTLDDVTESNYDFDEDELGKTRTRNTADKYSKNYDDELLHSLLYSLVETMLNQHSSSDYDETDSPLDEDEWGNSKPDVTGSYSTENNKETSNVDEVITNTPGFETSTHTNLPIDMDKTDNSLKYKHTYKNSTTKDWTSITVNDEESTRKNYETIHSIEIPHFPYSHKSASTATNTSDENHTSKNNKNESGESNESTTSNIQHSTSAETTEKARTIEGAFFQQNYLFDPKAYTVEPKISNIDTTSPNPNESKLQSSTEFTQTTTEVLPERELIISISTEKPTVDNPTTAESTVTTENPVSTETVTTADLNSGNFTQFLQKWPQTSDLKSDSYNTNEENRKTEASSTEKLASSSTTEQVVVANV